MASGRRRDGPRTSTQARTRTTASWLCKFWARPVRACAWCMWRTFMTLPFGMHHSSWGIRCRCHTHRSVGLVIERWVTRHRVAYRGAVHHTDGTWQASVCSGGELTWQASTRASATSARRARRTASMPAHWLTQRRLPCIGQPQQRSWQQPACALLMPPFHPDTSKAPPQAQQLRAYIPTLQHPEMDLSLTQRLVTRQLLHRAMTRHHQPQLMIQQWVMRLGEGVRIPGGRMLRQQRPCRAGPRLRQRLMAASRRSRHLRCGTAGTKAAAVPVPAS